MAWGRLFTDILNHRKFVELDATAGWLWARAIAYCWDQLTDGFVPRGQVPRLLPTSPARSLKAAKDLIKAGLWEMDPDGYRFHDWLDWNPPASQIREQRESARQRMR